MVDFKALKETVLRERQQKAAADIALAQDLAKNNQPAASFRGDDAVDELFDWLDQ